MLVKFKMTWGCVLGCAGLAALANALAAADNGTTDVNPYSVISDRNVFHLNPPPPPPPPPDPKPLDLPKVMLTGFVGKGSSMKVLLAIPPKDAKEFTYYTSLVPGQKDHDVELVRIHLEKEEVDIINSGTPQTLSVKSNSYLSAANAPPPAKGAPPGMPAGIGLRHQPPGLTPPNSPSPYAPSAATAPREGGSTIIAGGGGSSAIVAGGAGGTSGSTYGGSGFSSSGPIVSGGSSVVPTGAAAPGSSVGNQIANTLFNPSTGRYQMPTPPGPPLPREAQAALLLTQKAALDGGGPPLPASLESALDGQQDPGAGAPP
jgi:hypothetical protein